MAIDVSTAQRRLLDLVREHLGMDLAWLSDVTQGQQEFAHVSAKDGVATPAAGTATPLEGSYCVRVLDGRLPAVVPDARSDDRTRDLAVTQELGIGAYLGIPLTRRDGSVQGMLCCVNTAATPELAARDITVVQLLARVIAELGSGDNPNAEHAALRAEVAGLVAGAGRRHVLQPIVDVRSALPVGYEVLTRFDLEPFAPDVWFARAGTVGLRPALEVACARSGLAELQADRAGYLSINLSPDVITSGALNDLLAGVDAGRVMIEITEHAPVEDYDALTAALDPWRDRGLLVAVDDAGAGYASFRHILQLRPDVIKADLSLVQHIDTDPVRQALVSSLVSFGRTSGARLVAEGVERQQELDCLARLGVHAVQGYLFSRPVAEPPTKGFPLPSPHVRLDAGAGLSAVLAEAVRDATDLESLVRPLLEVMVRLTGLETAYMTLLREDGDLEHAFVRNAGSIELPEGSALPWSDSACAAMQSKGLVWSDQAQVDLVECAVAAEFALSTFVSVPVLGHDGQVVGTLCAGSTDRVFLDESTLAELRLIAYIVGRGPSAPRQPLAEARPDPTA